MAFYSSPCSLPTEMFGVKVGRNESIFHETKKTQ